MTIDYQMMWRFFQDNGWSQAKIYPVKWTTLQKISYQQPSSLSFPKPWATAFYGYVVAAFNTTLNICQFLQISQILPNPGWPLCPSVEFSVDLSNFDTSRVRVGCSGASVRLTERNLTAHVSNPFYLIPWLFRGFNL